MKNILIIVLLFALSVQSQTTLLVSQEQFRNESGSPSYLTGLIVDLDHTSFYNNGTLATNGENVTEWRNNVNSSLSAFQTVAASQPVVVDRLDGSKEILFDGSDFLDFGDKPELYFPDTKKYTIITCLGTGANNLFHYSAGLSYNANTMPMGMYNGNGTQLFLYNGGDRDITSNTFDPDDSTTVYIKDDVNTRYYQNDILKRTLPNLTYDKGNYPFIIGGTGSITQYRLQGSYRRFAMWNRALTPSEIAQVVSRMNSNLPL